MAARYWVGGTGNWDAADTTHWSASSGGSGGASVPGASDDVTFDASSGGGTVTVTADHSVKSVTGGAFTGTLNYGTGRTVTYQTFNFSGTGTRTLTLGDVNITITTGAFADVWLIQTTTGLTLSAASSTITLSGANAQFNSAIGTYGTIIFTGGGTTKLSNAATITCTNLTYTGTTAKTDNFQITGGLTCSGTFTVNSNSDINRVLVRTVTVGTARTITAATVVITNTVDFQDITGAGAATWTIAGTGATALGDCGGNSGITFSASVQQTWSGTSGGNWSANAWTTRVPLPQDDVVINAAFSASQTVTGDMPRLGKSIDWTGATGTPAWSVNSTANTIYGSVTLIAAMTITGGNSTTFAGRGNYSITSSGVTWTGGLTFASVTGTYTLVDGLTCNRNGSQNFNLSSGSFNDGGQTITYTGANSTWVFNTGTTLTATGIWNFGGTAAGTFFSASGTNNTSTMTIIITAVSANTRTFAGGGKTYGTLNYTVAGSTGQLNITGANSFAAINFSDASNARTLAFTAATTTTIRNANGFNVQGTAGKLMTVSSITAATHTLTSANKQACNYLNVTNSIVDASPKWYAGANSTDGTGNTNWIFTNDPAAASTGKKALLLMSRDDLNG